MHVALRREGHKRSSLASALVATPSSRSAAAAVGGTTSSATSLNKADTARKHIITELLQTEKNFVDILLIIVKVGYHWLWFYWFMTLIYFIQVFKEPLEHPTQRGGPIIDNEDIKSIFGNITEILGVHEKLVVSVNEI